MRKSTQAKTTSTKLKVKERPGRKSDASLAKVQKDLRAAQAEAKRERQARLQVEKALTEARKELAVHRLETEQEHQAQSRRASFVVRLMLDERG